MVVVDMDQCYVLEVVGYVYSEGVADERGYVNYCELVAEYVFAD